MTPVPKSLALHTKSVAMANASILALASFAPVAKAVKMANVSMIYAPMFNAIKARSAAMVSACSMPVLLMLVRAVASAI